ncbi:MAG: hypothetical protein K6U89_13975, partial [Chloroflexi bacterium]|nr:hypothetical protein [Chloroflexota bacterium]
MSTTPHPDQTRAALQFFSRTLVYDFELAATALQPRLSALGFAYWCEEALQIAQTSFRSWETAAEFLRVSPAMAERLDEAGLLEWARVARELTATSPIVAAAFILTSPRAVGRLAPGQLPRWARLGGRLHGESWKSLSLATRFFEESPALLTTVDLAGLELLTDVLAALALRSSDAAADCLENAARLLGRLAPEDRPLLLLLTRQLARTSWKTSQQVFKESPTLLRGLAPALRHWLLELATVLAETTPEAVAELLKEMAAALNAVPEVERARCAAQAQQLFPLSWRAAAAFLRSAPEARARAGEEGFAHWFAHGEALLRESEEAGIAFFRLQSARARQLLEAVSPGVSFEAVRSLLQLYCEALSGRRLRVISTAELTDRAVGWTNVERPATDGSAIHLPAYLEEYGDKEANFRAYKVLATHQAGHLEFGTFSFDFARPAAVFSENLRPTLPGRAEARGFERLFDGFANRALAKDLFAVVEDYRIDQRLRQEYPGIRQALAEVQAHALAQRPVERRPFQEQMVELVVRLSLAMEPADQFATVLRRYLVPLADPRATVEDAAEATIRLYRWITQVPNIPVMGDSYAPVRLEGEQLSVELDKGLPEELTAGQPYRSPAPVPYRDDLKPELVEAMARARESGQQAGEANGLSPDQLGELLEKSGELDLGDLSQGEARTSLGLLVTNILREAGQAGAQGGPPLTSTEPGRTSAPARHVLAASEPKVFRYDEWDFRANDYRPRWCRLKEQVLQEGSAEFFERTLLAHRGLVEEIRRQFELLRPEAFKRVKNLQHGEEFDLDATIDAIVQRRARQTPSDKIYWRKNKSERDVAVAFLLDMSASTDEEIEERPRSTHLLDPAPPLHWDRAGGWRWSWDEPLEEPRKRIIDIEKESLVLLIKALETIGDTYGIYGFSGYGRENVEFFTIKDLDERLSEQVKRRLDKISPVQGTRMGPALRHCVTKLRAVDARLKLLILVSDGRPQDHEYGRDRTEKEYAIHDTRMALLEA